MDQKSFCLVIVGRMSEERGKMARLMCEGCLRMGIDHLLVEGPPFPENLPPHSIVVHVSSKGRVPAVIQECESLNLPLIQASSGVVLPENPRIPIIDAPNLALPIVALFDILPRFGALMQSLGVDAEVAESHQPGKTSAPVTAQTILKWFGKAPEHVGSVRSKAIARAMLGVPPEHIDGHAYHFILAAAHGVEIKITTKIHGRDPYFTGVLAVARKIIESKSPLMPRVYPVAEFMFP